MSFKLTAACSTDVGQQREQNEDAVYAQVADDGETGLFIVADGMGGYQAGEVASRLVVETIQTALKNYLVPLFDQPTVRLPPISEQETLRFKPGVSENTTKSRLRPEPGHGQNDTVKFPETVQTQNIEEQITAAIRQANRAILAYGEQHSSARGMGCTVTLAVVDHGKVHIGNVGDSRTYLLRQGTLLPLTRDHSLVAKLIEAKQIQPDDVYTHPHRNLIYRSLGAGHQTVEPDVFHEVLQSGDKLLLCSDGLWEMVRLPLLLQTLSGQEDGESICRMLINLANANGGEDNIGVVVVQVQ
jgi:serine/threonine protein phosphatase PrpC